MTKRCPSPTQCTINLLARRKEEFRGATWNLLLSAGQDLCKEDQERARQSFDQSLKLAEDLSAVNDRDADCLRATALACLGALALCQNKADDALRYFQRSEAAFASKGERYGQAVVLYAEAHAYRIKQDWRRVFCCYEQSSRLLAFLASDPLTDYTRQLVREEHRQTVAEWEKDLGVDVERGAGKRLDFRLGFLPVFGKIAAGNPYPVPEDVENYIETDRFIIDGKPYAIAKSQHLTLNFSPYVMYVALCVSGDSMNMADINIGDYVILQVPSAAGLRLEPKTGDIVVLAFPEENTVTLKRCRRSPKKITFYPESTNPTHLSYEFDASLDIPVRIVGIHVATLKPL